MQETLTAEAIRLAKADPQRALEVGAALVTNEDAEVRAGGHYARGRALFELAKNNEALAELDLARGTAASPGLTSRIEISMAAALVAGGRRTEAEALLERHRTNPDPVVAALALSQRGLLALGDGSLSDAVIDLRDSIEPLEQSETDGDAAARAVGNLAFCQMALGLLNEAEVNYQRAVDLGARFGEELVVAGCLQNLGYLAMRRGHLAEAIDRLNEAEQTYRSINAPARNLSTLFDDLAETHRIAGMTGPAVRHATAALDAVRHGGNEDKIAEARYRLAVCALDDGDADTAIRESRLAAEAFAAAGRDVWNHRAWALSLDVEGNGEASGSAPEPTVVTEAARAAEALERAGLVTDGLRIRNRIAQQLLAHPSANHQITQLLHARPDNPDQSIMSRLEALFASALSARADGQPATAHLLDAHELITFHYQRLADPELRAGAARLAHRFRNMDIDDVDQSDTGDNLLRVEERWRALSFDVPRVVPSSDPELAEKSEALRHATATLAAADHWDPDAAATVQRLEEEIQPLSLRTRSRFLEAPGRVAALDLDRLGQTLDGRTFLEWVEVGPSVIGVMVTGDRVERWDCGDAGHLQATATTIMATVARLLRPGLSDAGQQRAWRALTADAHTLGARLLPPTLDPRSGLVLSPPPALAPLPWSLLVGTPEQSICLTPSATMWLGRRTGDIPATIGIAVGPGLDHGHQDTSAIDTVFPRTETLSAEAATAGAVRSLIGRSGIAHIAAHGTFRSDSPRFSTLLFADGPLALYELDADTSVAPLVVLASCDGGRTAARAGSELLGFGPTLLTAGATNVVAPSVPVPDQAMSDFVGTFYRELPGRRPSDALAAARNHYRDGSVPERVLASAVLCSGADCGYVSTAGADPSDAT